MQNVFRRRRCACLYVPSHRPCSNTFAFTPELNLMAWTKLHGHFALFQKRFTACSVGARTCTCNFVPNRSPTGTRYASQYYELYAARLHCWLASCPTATTSRHSPTPLTPLSAIRASVSDAFLVMDVCDCVWLACFPGWPGRSAVRRHRQQERHILLLLLAAVPPAPPLSCPCFERSGANVPAC